MPTLATFAVAAFVLAVMPGPGMFYILGRTLAAGRGDGYASVVGTAVGGLVHVIAGVLGISALVLASASAFTILKVAGGLYLIYLGVQTWCSAGQVSLQDQTRRPGTLGRAFRDGITVEATNPKTAVFFLAVIPQFIDPSHALASQFFVLGTVSILMNSIVASAVVTGALHVRSRLLRHPSMISRIRQGTGVTLAGLGVWLLMSRRPA